MGAAGCTDLWIGVENGSQRVIDAMKKGFSIPVAEANIRNYREAGIHTEIYLMAGFPTKTAEDFEETLGFLRRNASAISIISVDMVSIDCQCALRIKASPYGGMKKPSIPIIGRAGTAAIPFRKDSGAT
jgi:radical SAM superfamily enzyme YgiQ (UPF0313 family)